MFLDFLEEKLKDRKLAMFYFKVLRILFTPQSKLQKLQFEENIQFTHYSYSKHWEDSKVTV